MAALLDQKTLQPFKNEAQNTAFVKVGAIGVDWLELNDLHSRRDPS